MPTDPTSAKAISELISRLRGRPVPTNWNEFISQSELSRIVTYGPLAYTPVQKAFATETSVNAKLSLGYLLVALGGASDTRNAREYLALFHHENPQLRSMAGNLASYFPGLQEHASAYLAKAPDLEEVTGNFLAWNPSISWMSTEDLGIVLTRSMDMVRQGNPYTNPPAWLGGDNNVTVDGNVASVSTAAFRVRRFEVELAESALQKLLYSTRSHDTVSTILKDMELDNGSDHPKLGIEFNLALRGLAHLCELPNCRLDCENRLLNLCERWAWKTSDPSLLCGILDSLHFMMKSDRVRTLLEKLSKDHSNQEVREISARSMADYLQGLAEAERAKQIDAIGTRQAADAAVKRYQIIVQKSNPSEQNAPTAEVQKGSPAPKPLELKWIIGVLVGLVTFISVVIWIGIGKRRQ